MTWPIADATKVHLDAATDDPSQARVELATLVDLFNTLKALISQTPGAAQLPLLNSSGDLQLSTALAVFKRTASLNFGSPATTAFLAQNGVGLAVNCYLDNGAWKYLGNGTACAISFSAGSTAPVFYYANAGVAGNTITWASTSAMWHAGNTGNGTASTTLIDANTIKGVDYLWAFGNSLGTSGHQRIQGGYIRQWGTFSGTSASITFPIAFPNTFYGGHAVYTAASSSGGASISAVILSPTTSGMGIGYKDYGSAAVTGGYWEAWGK